MKHSTIIDIAYKTDNEHYLVQFKSNELSDGYSCYIYVTLNFKNNSEDVYIKYYNNKGVYSYTENGYAILSEKDIKNFINISYEKYNERRFKFSD